MQRRREAVLEKGLLATSREPSPKRNSRGSEEAVAEEEEELNDGSRS